MTSIRDSARIAALEVKVSALTAIVEELRDKFAKLEAEKQVRQQKDKAA
jgi:uncharacterized coiled-coil protein SlyX